MAVGLLLYGLAGGAGLLATTYPTLIASRAVFGVAILFTSTTKTMLTLYQGTQRDRAMGWRSTATRISRLQCWPLPRCPRKLGRRSASMAPRWVCCPLRLAQLDVIAPAVVAVFTSVMAGIASLISLGYARVRATLSTTASWCSRCRCGWVAFAILGFGDHPAVIVAGVVTFGLGAGTRVPHTDHAGRRLRAGCPTWARRRDVRHRELPRPVPLTTGTGTPCRSNQHHRRLYHSGGSLGNIFHSGASFRDSSEAACPVSS
ncbi:MAG: hypothetical protein M3332_08280 [Actinomycetota bacterium]|nr:hypothetical protein [Actinomycetota bacterium]